MFCFKCGATIGEDSISCMNCGAKAPLPDTPPPLSSTPYVSPFSAPPPQRGKTAVVRAFVPIVTLILLTIVFSFIVFLIVDLLPWDPVHALTGIVTSEEDLQQIRVMYGLDKPLITRYLRALCGDFGLSYLTRQPVIDIVIVRLPGTILMILLGLVVSFVFAVPLGIIAAAQKNKIVDIVFSFFSIISKSIPFFLVGLLLLLLLCVDLGWLPAGGTGTWLHFVMPVITLAFLFFGFAMQAVRASAIKARNDKTGLFFPDLDIDKKHPLQSAILPTVSKSGLQLGWLFFGVIFVDLGFAYPGVVNLFIQGINERDKPVILGGAMALLAVFITIAAIVGLLYAGVTYISRAIAGK